jgi:hypothetical protein
MDADELYFGEWMSVYCGNKYHGYVCQKESSLFDLKIFYVKIKKNSFNAFLLLSDGFVIPTFPTPSFTTPSQKCGANWVERPFSNYCYHFSTSVDEFAEADQKCQSIGGRLTSITSSEEQLFIQSDN